MVSPLLGLPQIVANALGGIFFDAILVHGTVPSSPAYDAWDPPAAEETSYTCKALVENYSERYRAEGLIDQKDRKVLVLVDTLSITPVKGDRITVSGVSFTVIEVSTDPATAVWVLQGRM